MSAMKITSQSSAIDAPSPTAGPFSAATIGSSTSSRSQISCFASRRSGSRLRRSSSVESQPKSPPALKARPEPVSSTARAALSRRSSRNSRPSSSWSSSSTAFSSLVGWCDRDAQHGAVALDAERAKARRVEASRHQSWLVSPSRPEQDAARELVGAFADHRVLRHDVGVAQAALERARAVDRAPAAELVHRGRDLRARPRREGRRAGGAARARRERDRAACGRRAPGGVDRRGEPRARGRRAPPPASRHARLGERPLGEPAAPEGGRLLPGQRRTSSSIARRAMPRPTAATPTASSPKTGKA